MSVDGQASRKTGSNRDTLTPDAARKRLQEQAVAALVVEDDGPLQQLVVTLLEKSGFEVDCVSDGSAALHALNDKSYAVVLLDLMMPVCNGLEVLSRLRLQTELLSRVILMTGVNQKVVENIDRSGTFGLVRKPFDVFELLGLAVSCAVGGEGDDKEAG